MEGPLKDGFTEFYDRTGLTHEVQLFDSIESRADAVVSFAAAGLSAGEAVLIVIASDHAAAIEAGLRDRGIDPDQVKRTGQFVVRDATTVLKQLLRFGRPDRVRFDALIGDSVRELTSRWSGLCVYGEVVDLLAAQGDLQGALELEELWNGLATRHAFSLFCGYTAAHFGNERDSEALQAICRAHSCVRSNPHDLLASFLVSRADGSNIQGV